MTGINKMNHLFVSRAGVKLQAALEKFNIDVKDKVVLDVGSSTGGFVDCLLQNGARKVYAVDTAYGELAWKLRNDPRVIVMERTNILYLNSLPEGAATNLGKRTVRDDLRENQEIKVDVITIDSGWTKLELVLPAVKKFLKNEGVIIALLKPHYETDFKNLKGGVVPTDLVEQIKERVIKNIGNLGFKIDQVITSPILGTGGNKEYLLKILNS